MLMLDMFVFCGRRTIYEETMKNDTRIVGKASGYVYGKASIGGMDYEEEI